MIIDAHKTDGDSTLSIVNQDATYKASLYVEKNISLDGALSVGTNITLGGTVDGVDLAAFKSAYDTHDHSAGDPTQISHANLTNVTADQHHNQVHALVGSDHTVSGLTVNHVLLATGATTFAFGQLDHGALGGLGDDDHPQYAALAQNETITGAWTFPNGGFKIGSDTGVARHEANQLGPLAGDALRSSNYTSGVSGWYVGDDYAEFANAFIRGELHAAVFVKDLVSAHAGLLGVYKSAGKLSDDMTIPASGTWYMYLDDPPGGGYLLDNSDIVRVKAEYSGGVGDTWFTVGDRADMGDGRQRYTCVWQSGTKGITYPAGTGVLDYGTSGDGGVLLAASTATANGPYVDIRTHSGSPWTSETLRVRMGNLDGVTDTDLNPSGWGLYATNVFLKGDLIAGDGDVGANDNGFWINGAGSSPGDRHAYKIYDSTGSTIKAYFGPQEYAYIGDSDGYYAQLGSREENVLIISYQGNAVGDATAKVSLQALAYKNGDIVAIPAVLAVEADRGGGGSRAWFGAGEFAICSTVTGDPDDDVIKLSGSGDIRCSGGLCVGSTETDPATGDIHATNGMVIHTPGDPYFGYAIDMYGVGAIWSRRFGFYSGTTWLGGFGGYGGHSGSDATLTHSWMGKNWNDYCLRVYTNDGRAVLGYYMAPSGKCSGPSLTINQAAYDGPILVLQSSDVGHGMTTFWDSDTYGSFGKYSADYGGLMMDGVSESSQGLNLRGIVTAADETHSAGGAGCVQIVAWLKDGTTVQAPTGADNILAIRAGSSTRAIFTAAGDLYLDASTHSFDKYDDCQLVRAVELHRSPASVIESQFDQFVRYNRQVLEETGLIAFNDDGHNFVNLSGMSRLHSGAIWQLYVEKEQLKERVEALEQEIKLLKAA